jgi:hypothetical protein
VFQVKIFEAEGGVKISKKDMCAIEIVQEVEQLNKMRGIEKVLEMMQAKDEVTWCS